MVYASTHLSVSSTNLLSYGKKRKVVRSNDVCKAEKTQKNDSDFSVHAVLRTIQYNVETINLFLIQLIGVNNVHILTVKTRN